MTVFNIYDRKNFAKDAVVVRSGEPAFIAYLIQSGTAKVYKEGEGGRKELGSLQPGDIIGDMALIRKSNHQSTVIAAEAMVTVTIPPDHLEKCIRDADPLMKTFLKSMIRRIDRMNAEL